MQIGTKPLAGALAAIYWHDDLMRMRDKASTGSSAALRERVADMLDSVEASVGDGLDRTRAATRSTLRSWSDTVRGGTEDEPARSPRSESV